MLGREGIGLQADAIDRAGGEAELATGAFTLDDGMELFEAAGNGIDRAHAQAFGATNTSLRVDACNLCDGSCEIPWRRFSMGER